MKNCVVVVKKTALDLLCKNYPQFALRKWFDEGTQQFRLNIEEYTGNRSFNVICYGMEKSDEVHFTYNGYPEFTHFFTYYRIEFSFSETEESVLNYPSLFGLTS
ncbi:hypothetical protein P2G70_11810 [Mannheimia haemolytica]|nr:hypothetical protein [Mannheimia haemolytica]